MGLHKTLLFTEINTATARKSCEIRVKASWFYYHGNDEKCYTFFILQSQVELDAGKNPSDRVDDTPAGASLRWDQKPGVSV